MMLLLLLAAPLSLGLLALALKSQARFLACAAILANLSMTIYAYLTKNQIFRADWLPQWGIQIHLELDGLSFALILTSHAMALLAVWGSARHIKKHHALFYANLLGLLTGIIGILLSFDLLLFFIFWELMIIPIYLACVIWGGAKRYLASMQFLIFTQVSGLIMLVAILSLYFAHFAQSGLYTFDFSKLVTTKLDMTMQLVLLTGFMAAFLVKLPALGFHIWLPTLFEACPLGLILVGVMIKTGAYGIMRFVLPMFPDAVVFVAPFMMFWGGAGIIYGAILAFSQNDIRKILAYATISHMGVVLMALFSQSAFALNGVVILLITEALSTGGLLLLFSRFNHVTLEHLGGLWTSAPKIGALALCLIMSSVGLPFLGNFVGEYMSLVGIFASSKIAAGVMCLGIILSALYYLRLLQKIFFGALTNSSGIDELNLFQTVIFGGIISLLVFIGLYPAPLLSVLAQTTLLLE